MFRISPERPEDYSFGRPGSAGSDAPKTGASASFDAPSRYPGVSLLRVLDRPASVVRLTRLPRSRPGTWLRRPRPRVPHPAPPNMTRHDSALGERDMRYIW